MRVVAGVEMCPGPRNQAQTPPTVTRHTRRLTFGRVRLSRHLGHAVPVSKDRAQLEPDRNSNRQRRKPHGPRDGTPHARRARYTASVVRNLRPGPAQLADVLAGFRARGHAAVPSQEWLAKRLNRSTRTIRRWTNELEAAEHLDVDRHAAHHDPITGRWKRRTNRYRCRFKTKRGAMTGKDLVTPSGHECPHNDLPGVVQHGLDPPDLRSEGDGEPIPAAPTRPPWIATGTDAREWVNRKMGRL